MTVRVLALASGVTSLESHRLGLMPMSISAGVLNNRSGVYPAIGAASLSTISAMVCSIDPFYAWIDGTSGSLQGGYIFVNDAAVNITIDAGNASTVRTDRIIARVQDNPYDASGVQTGTVEYLKGNTTTGVATALPVSSLLLYEVAVPVGASAGSGGINFGTAATSKIVFTAASGGVLPLASGTERDAMTSPTEGQFIFRKDLDVVDYFDGTSWKIMTVPRFSSTSAFTNIPNPTAGTLAMPTDTRILHEYSGSAWLPNHRTYMVHMTRVANQTYSNGTFDPVQWDTVISNDFELWSSGSNTRITANVSGYWMFSARVSFDPGTGFRTLSIRKNASSEYYVQQGHDMVGYTGISTGGLVPMTSGDYVDVYFGQGSGADRACTAEVTAFLVHTI